MCRRRRYISKTKKRTKVSRVTFETTDSKMQRCKDAKIHSSCIQQLKKTNSCSSLTTVLNSSTHASKHLCCFVTINRIRRVFTNAAAAAAAVILFCFSFLVVCCLFYFVSTTFCCHVSETKNKNKTTTYSYTSVYTQEYVRLFFDTTTTYVLVVVFKKKKKKKKWWNICWRTNLQELNRQSKQSNVLFLIL